MIAPIFTVTVALGIGNELCSTWTREHAAHSVRTDQLDQWVLGYVSGVREFDGKVEVTVSDGAVLRGVDDFCRVHPDNVIKNVTGAVYIGFRADAFMDNARKPR